MATGDEWLMIEATSPCYGDPWASFDNWLVKNNMVDQWWDADEDEVMRIIEEYNSEYEIGSLFEIAREQYEETLVDVSG